MRDLLLARDYQQSALYWRSHRMAVDAYCLQHSKHVASAKSLAAHLCGLCVAFEYDNSEAELQRLQRWLSKNPEIQRPALPSFRGELNIGSVVSVNEPASWHTAVEAWAASVWAAYRDVQPLAREWLVRSRAGRSR